MCDSLRSTNTKGLWWKRIISSVEQIIFRVSCSVKDSFSFFQSLIFLWSKVCITGSRCHIDGSNVAWPSIPTTSVPPCPAGQWSSEPCVWLLTIIFIPFLFTIVQLLSHVWFLCGLMDCSRPGSSARGIFLPRILEWIAMPFSRGSSQLRDQTHISSVSSIGRRVLYH